MIGSIQRSEVLIGFVKRHILPAKTNKAVYFSRESFLSPSFNPKEINVNLMMGGISLAPQITKV